jgi:serine/threonine protein kinase
MVTYLETAFVKYRKGKQIGAGGAGQVFEVFDENNQRFAAKILSAENTSTTRLKRFKNELHFCFKNRQKHLIPVVDFGKTSSGETFYVMPHYPQTLRNVMSSGPSGTLALEIFAQILDGVESAHLLGVTHRDLKPENILYDPEINSIVVADFGIAHFEEEDLLTAVETKNQDRLANFQYSAPEQRLRGRSVGVPADIYALGLMLNELFTGEIPQGVSFKRVEHSNKDFAYLDNVVEEMLHQDPAARLQTVQAVKERLIARKNQFVSFQTLNELKNTVVPETDIIDPLLNNPISVTGFDFVNGRLSLKLSAVPNSLWLDHYKNMMGYQWTSLIHPRMFHFSGNTVSVQIDSHHAQSAINHVKKYVDTTNRQYAEHVRKDHHKRLQERRAQLQQQAAAEDERQKLLTTLKI